MSLFFLWIIDFCDVLSAQNEVENDEEYYQVRDVFREATGNQNQILLPNDHEANLRKIRAEAQITEVISEIYNMYSDHLKDIGAEKTERLMILEQWLEFEKKINDEVTANLLEGHELLRCSLITIFPLGELELCKGTNAATCKEASTTHHRYRCRRRMGRVLGLHIPRGRSR